jgi:hypothetical protein
LKIIFSYIDKNKDNYICPIDMLVSIITPRLENIGLDLLFIKLIVYYLVRDRKISFFKFYIVWNEYLKLKT